MHNFDNLTQIANPIDRALRIACDAHRDQKDRYGQPYVLHPLRVMARMKSPPEQVTALLHDVVEDSPWTLGQLREAAFDPAIVDAVDCLTKREGESYQELIARAASNPLAQVVKLADLEDNMDMRRMDTINESDLERLRKYRAAWESLSKLQARLLSR